MVRKLKHSLAINQVPKVFVPKFWDQADQRSTSVRAFRRRCEDLLDHSGADTVMKEMLCERAAFLSVRLETMEVEAIVTGEFNAALYSNLSNTFLGILKALGLQRQMPKTIDLKAYVKEVTNGRKKEV